MRRLTGAGVRMVDGRGHAAGYPSRSARDRATTDKTERKEKRERKREFLNIGRPRERDAKDRRPVSRTPYKVRVDHLD